MTAPDIEQEIERTRLRLGETVDELASRADVKARARDKVAELSGRVRQSRIMQRRWPLVLAAGVLVAGSAVLWRRRRS